MHFALPPRKTSHPPPYARSARSSTARRKQLQIGALLVCAALIVFYLVIKSFSSPSNRVPPGTPEVVIVTVLDSDMTKDYTEKIEENRGYYATKHGISTYRAIMALTQVSANTCSPQATRCFSPTLQITISEPHRNLGLSSQPCVML